jgi:hypothetical protein
MGNINSSHIAKAQVDSANKPARTENKSPHPDKAPAGSANESAKTGIKRSHTHTVDSETNEASTAPLGGASKSTRIATESRRGKIKGNCRARPKDKAGVRSCG